MKKTLKNSCFTLLSATLISATAFSGVVFAANAGATGWKQEGSSWKHYNEAGVLTKGFIKLGEDWYYLNQADGTMKTGWLQHTDGNWYFFNTLSDGSKGKMLTGWQWIDGYCYYFSTAKDVTEGKMLANTKTPDGFLVNADGRWAEGNGSVHFVAGKGRITKVAASASKANLRSGGGSGSSGRGSSSNYYNDSRITVADVETSLVAAEYTKLVDLGWIEYAVVTFKQGTLEDYNILVNGVDVTAAVSKVDDTGKIVKWATTVSAPKNIEVVRKSDNKRESLSYSNGKTTVAPSVGSKEDAPAYILTNGPISVFDYHLNNYDENGNVRKYPTTTTFDLSNNRKLNESKNLPKANYVAPVEINAEGNGQIVIKLTLDENSKKWFDELSNAKILDYEYKTLNNAATFTKEMDTSHANTGIVKINLPQSNVRNNGRYFVNLASDYSNDKYTVAVQVVRDTNYVLSQSTETPNPRIGNADVLFNIAGPNGETFGNDLKMPVTGVDLKFPSGKIVSLKNIEEYSVIMNVLHIYEKYKDKDTNEERILLNEVGKYKVTVHADGYKDMSKEFEIAADTSFRANAEVDTYSSATGGGSISLPSADGSSSTSSAGYNINANLLFEHDLLANALILNEIGLRNVAATTVVNRFLTYQKSEGVLTTDLTPIYDFADFLNKVKSERMDASTQLSFAEYLNGATKQRAYVGKIKRVLEDGLLGPVENLGDSIGEDTTVTGVNAREDADFELSFTDANYLSKIEGIYLDGRGTALRSDSTVKQYEIVDGKLKIFASVLKNSFGIPYVGKHSLRIVAKGYKVQDLTLVVEREEGNITITTENTDNLKLNEELKFNVQINNHDAANVLKSLKELVIINKATNTEKTVLPIGQESNDKGYKIENGTIVLAPKTVTEVGNYTLVIKTNGYGQRQVDFSVKADESADTSLNHEGMEAPSVKSVTLIKKNPNSIMGQFEDDNNYEVEFNGTTQEKKAFVGGNKEIKVAVNGKNYTKVVANGNVRDNQFRVGYSSDNNKAGSNFLHLAANGFDQDTNTVVVTVEGYKPLTFTVNKNASTGGTENSTTPVAPTPVTPEQPPVTPAPAPTPVTPAPVTPTEPADNSNNENAGKETPTFKSSTFVAKATGMFAMFADADKYVVEFNPVAGSDDASITSWLDTKKNLKVTVNGKEYVKALSTLENSQFKIGQSTNTAYGGAYKYLHLAANGFDQDTNTVVVTVEGYKPLTFTVKKNGSTSGTENSTTPVAPTPAEPPVASTPAEPVRNEDAGKETPTLEYSEVKEYGFDNLLSLVFNKQEDLQDWLNSVKVNVNGQELVKESSSWASPKGNKYKLSKRTKTYIQPTTNNALVFDAAILTKTNNIIKVTADGYKEFTLILDQQGNKVENVVSNEPAAEEEETTLADAPKYTLSLGSSILNPNKIILQPNDKNFTTEREIDKKFISSDSFKVILNDTEIPKGRRGNYPNTGYYGTETGYSATNTITIDSKFLKNGNNTVTLKADGYKPITMTIPK